MMVLKEQQRSLKMQSISNDVSFITNLQNLKQGLKQDYSDKEILDLLLGNAQFTDKLIAEHLGKSTTSARASKDGSQQTKYVARDASSYRDFVMRTYFSKDQEDPFSHFYIKESGKVERVVKLRDEAEQYEKVLGDHRHPAVGEKTQRLLKTL